MAEVWRALNPKKSTTEWGPKQKAAYKSVFTNRQWPQARLHKAGLVDHPKCMLCYAAEVSKRGGQWQPPENCSIVEAALEAAPVGTLMIWHCGATADLRQKHAPACMKELADQASVHGTPAFERALFPSLSPTIPPPKSQPTFVWDVRPPGGTYQGKIYTDGSRLNGKDPRTGRNGWAFTVKNSIGRTLAAAHGVPPDWVEDIPGTEAWAVKEAAIGALPGCELRVDCLPCVNAFKAGMQWATTDRRKHARVHRSCCRHGTTRIQTRWSGCRHIPRRQA